MALGGTNHMVGRDAIVHCLTVDFPRMFVADVALDFRWFYAEQRCGRGGGDHAATLTNAHAYRNDYCFVFALRGGLIHRVREYMDTANGHRMVFDGA
ncbi:hypothetical protein ACIHFD_01550 [Nonomuraea sp. NPDC051941]|uniref:hypothetical protein n=1 Tax=Nonomuraea sp. NPDC051941 TaxID=3364373 RepID=UPI0037CBE6C1